jgi:hypothetical protein
MAQPRTFEGTWEELQSKATRFKGKRVRVTLLAAIPEKPAPKKKRFPKCVDKATEEFLKRFSGSWKGDDLEECIDLVYKTRSKTKW